MLSPGSKVLCSSLYAVVLALVAFFPLNADNSPASRPGYYRFPAIHGDIIIFTAEGDLWSVNAKGGTARRLTSNPGEEFSAAISPDGKTVAFTAEYEGTDDVYTMPVDGGLPQRRTWDASANVAGWTPDGRVLYRTARYSMLPDAQLVVINSEGRRESFHSRKPLKAASLLTAKLCSSPASASKEAAPSAIKAVPLRTYGGTIPGPRPFL